MAIQTTDKKVQRAAVSRATSGEIIAAISGKRIRLLGFVLIAAAEVTVKFRTDTTDLTGVMTFAAKTPVVVPAAGEANAWLRGALGKNINIVLGSDVQISGFLLYTAD